MTTVLFCGGVVAVGSRVLNLKSFLKSHCFVCCKSSYIKQMRYNCYFCYLSAFGLSEGIFSSFFVSFIHTIGENVNKGGDMMEDDAYMVRFQCHVAIIGRKAIVAHHEISWILTDFNVIR